MKILGIDPGYERIGIAVIDKSGSQKEELLYSECFKTSAKLPMPERLHLIGQRISDIIKEYTPDTLAIETLFFTNNQKTALAVSEVRGMVMYISMQAGLDVSEHTPNQIKTAITGYGKSDKTAMMKIIPMLVKMPVSGKGKTGGLDDEYDAIAVALTCLACNKNRHLLQI